ncbi:MAG: 2Fe-2S ferredoxin [Halieaceae bacterium]|jgi:2Fe-2S ferredoxin
MAKIHLIQFDGNVHTLEAAPGASLMQSVVDEGIPGIDGDCGGACACGTCHCFIEGDWQGTLGQVDAMEESMLSMRPDRADNSRLSCQITVSEEMDGMVVRLPEYQM